MSQTDAINQQLFNRYPGRIGAFVYGLGCYAVFLYAFCYGIAYIAGLSSPRTIDIGPAASTGVAALIDLVFLSVFYLQHSLMARQSFKLWWRPWVPEPVERSTYVLCTSLALILLFWAWRPIPAVVWHIDTPFLATAVMGLSFVGWLIVVFGTFLINHFEFSGLLQVTYHLNGRPMPAQRLSTHLLYNLVRHPIYLGMIIAFWAAPTMTVGHLLFALFNVGYILVGLTLEERDLVSVFGDEYRRYKARVPMLVPRRFKGHGSSKIQSGTQDPDAELTEAERRFGLASGQFPFQSRFVECNGARVHYIDEGSGPLLFMLHGNPTWSFLYRRLVLALRGEFRCVALDLPGFGLSDAPPGFGFRPDEQAAVVSRFLEALDLRDATLVAHDWGGSIGLSAAMSTGRVSRLCLGNSWAWPVNDDMHFALFSKLLGGRVGRFAADRFAVFINALMPTAMRRRKLTPAEMAAYRAPFANGRSRSPLHIFPEQIVGASAWLGELETRVAAFKGPVHFIWPEKDFAFREKELAHWLRIFPAASVTRLPNCGHYLWEDAPEECAEAVRRWMVRRDTGTPAPS